MSRVVSMTFTNDAYRAQKALMTPTEFIRGVVQAELKPRPGEATRAKTKQAKALPASQ